MFVVSPGSLTIKTQDPLLHDFDTPLTAVLYPLGFRLNLATNSRDVLDAAVEAWGAFAPAFDCEPVELEVIVLPGGEFAGPPVFRARRRFFGIVSDRDNFAWYDSASFYSVCYVSQATAADHRWFRWFFLETIVYMLLAQRYTVPIHAACLVRDGAGVLLCGVSGAGKSTLAWALARAGWTYVGDDATLLLPFRADHSAIGKPHQIRFRDDAPQLFPELAPYISRTRPNGKIGIEIPLSDFPEIRTALECRVGCVIFLERDAGVPPRVEPMSGDEVAAHLLGDMPNYGEEVNSMHERTVRTLVDVPAYRMRYHRLDDAVARVGELARTLPQQS